MYTNERLQNYINAGITLTENEEKQHKEKMKQTWHFLKDSPDALATFRRDAVINRLRIIEHRLDNRRTNDPSNLLHYADREVKFDLVDATDWVEVIQSLEIPATVGLNRSHYDTTDIESEESDGEEHLAPMEDLPYSSENHIAQTLPGEILAGGMPKKHPRKKGKARSQRERPARRSSDPTRPKIHRDLAYFKDSIVPKEVVIDIPYQDIIYLTNSGQTAAGVSYHTNDAYDPQVSIGGNPSIGLITWGDFYLNYRVLGYKAEFEMVNTQAFPILVVNTHSTEDSTAVTGVPAMWKLATNANSRSFTLSQSGTPGAKHSWSVAHSITKIVGSDSPLTADNFMGLISGALRPADHTYTSVGISTQSANVLTTGVFMKLMLRQRVLLYSRREVIN